MMWLIGGVLVCGLVGFAIREIRWRRFRIPAGCRELGTCGLESSAGTGLPIVGEAKLSIVLPIKIESHHGQSELERIQLLLLPSLLRFLALDDLQELLIIAPLTDLEEVRKGVDSFATALRIRVICDSDVAPRIEGMESGWAKQQILKLAAANLLQTRLFLVLDSDNLMVGPASYASLCPGGRPRITYEPYRVHARWWRLSARMLRYSSRLKSGREGLGVTPQILHTEICRSLQSEIEFQNGKGPWECLLARHRGWSEYTLYWLFLLKHHDPKELYCDAAPLHRECIWKNADELTPEFVTRLFSNGEVPFTVLQSRVPGLRVADINALVRPYLE